MTTEIVPSFTVQPYFTAIGCNNDGKCLSWDKYTGLIAYAGSNLISIYNPDITVNRIITTMNGHKHDISVVKWFPPSCIERYSSTNKSDNNNSLLIGKVISGCSGGDVYIWNVYQYNVKEYQQKLLNLPISSKSLLTTQNNSSNDGKILYTNPILLKLPDKAKKSSIIDISVFDVSDNMVIIVVLTSAGGVYIYGQIPTSNEQKFYLLQELWFSQAHLQQVSQMCIYPHPSCPIVLLALGNVIGTISLFGTSIPQKINGNENILQQYDLQTKEINNINNEKTFFAPLGVIKGHHDWIRDICFSLPQYDSHSDLLTNIFMATASQDKTIRITSLHFPPKAICDILLKEAQPDDGNTSSSIDDSPLSLIASSTLGDQGHLYSISNDTNNLFFASTLDSVIFGHENWVVSIEWYTDPNTYALTLLSVSTDHTIVEWQQQDPSLISTSSSPSSPTSPTSSSASLWIPIAKLGQGQGYFCYYGGCYGPDAKTIVGIAYNGSLSLWRQDESQNTSDSILQQQQQQQPKRSWKPSYCPTGHNQPVVDVIACHGDDTKSFELMATAAATASASPTEQLQVTTSVWNGPVLPYIMTTSKDQTTRVFSPYVITKNNTSKTISNILTSVQNNPTMLEHSWYELARPQIHGWDLCGITAVSMLNAAKTLSTHHHEIVSAAEEKVLRIFRAPALFLAYLYAVSTDIAFTRQNFIELLQLLTAANDGDISQVNQNSRALCAVQPQLGLSNKPILLGDALDVESQAIDLDAAAAAAAAAFANGGQVSSSLSLASSSTSDSDTAEIDVLLDQAIISSSAPPKAISLAASSSQLILSPPCEEQLSCSTLWSEIDKLYGHGYDLKTIASTYASSSNDPYLFSANHARKANSARVRVWVYPPNQSTDMSWEETNKGIVAHQQTVTSMSITYNNQHIVTVGRDMTIGVAHNTHKNVSEMHETPFTLYHLCPNAHSRQIFNCSWLWDIHPLVLPYIITLNKKIKNFFDNITTLNFATSARDKLIKIWSIPNHHNDPSQQEELDKIQITKPTVKQTIRLSSPATALYNYTYISYNGNTDDKENQYEINTILFAGLENGQIHLYRALSSEATNFVHIGCIDTDLTHGATINKITAFTPISNDSQQTPNAEKIYEQYYNGNITLITASDDHSTKIFQIKL